MVQIYIKQLSTRGGVVNRAIANVTGQSLLIHYPNLAGEICMYSSLWAQRLFGRMDFKKRRQSVDTPD